MQNKLKFVSNIFNGDTTEVKEYDVMAKIEESKISFYTKEDKTTYLNEFNFSDSSLIIYRGDNKLVFKLGKEMYNNYLVGGIQFELACLLKVLDKSSNELLLKYDIKTENGIQKFTQRLTW